MTIDNDRLRDQHILDTAHRLRLDEQRMADWRASRRLAAQNERRLQRYKSFAKAAGLSHATISQRRKVMRGLTRDRFDHTTVWRSKDGRLVVVTEPYFGAEAAKAAMQAGGMLATIVPDLVLHDPRCTVVMGSDPDAPFDFTLRVVQAARAVPLLRSGRR